MATRIRKRYRPLTDDYLQINAVVEREMTGGKSETKSKGAHEICPTAAAELKDVLKRWGNTTPESFFKGFLLGPNGVRLANREQIGKGIRGELAGGPPIRLETITTSRRSEKTEAGFRIDFDTADSPFGVCLLATTDGKVCFLGFPDSTDENDLVTILGREWPGAVLRRTSTGIDGLVRQIFSGDGREEPLGILLKGTAFQLQVWQALTQVGAGELVSYQDIAAAIGRDDSCRATAHAIGANPTSFLIPCHRVIAKSGYLHHYRWGAVRKMIMIGRERGQLSSYR